MNDAKPSFRSSEAAAAVPAAAGQTKIAAVLALLEEEKGAALDDLVAATGWQKHTARAVLTGLNKQGNTVEREKVNGISRYRITKEAAQ